MDANSMEYVKIGLLVIIAALAFANLNTLKAILEKLNDNARPVENTAVATAQNVSNSEVATTTINESRVTEEDLNDEEKLVAIMAAMIDASEDNSGSVVKVKSIRRIA